MPHSPPVAPEPAKTRTALSPGGRHLSRVLLTLILAGIPGLFLLFLDFQLLDSTHKLSRKTEQENMRQVLRRISERGSHQHRFSDELTRIAHLGFPLPRVAEHLAALMTTNRQVVETYLFDATLKRVPLPGFPTKLTAASERVLQKIVDPDKAVNEKLITGFTGNRNVPGLMRDTPEFLVDLLNGNTLTWGGWWPLKSPGGKPLGHLIAFVHRQGIKPEALLDLAVTETNRLTRDLFACGWSDPLHPQILRPAGASFPAGLHRSVAAMQAGRSTSLWSNRTLVTFNGEDGEILFALANVPLATHAFTRRWGPLLLPLLLSIAWWLSGNLLGSPSLRDKLVWMFVIGSGFPIAIFLSAVILDRQTREEILLEKTRQTNLDRLIRLDGRYFDQFLPLLREYDRLVSGMTASPAIDPVTSGENLARIKKQYQRFVTGLVIVNDNVQAQPYENTKESAPATPTTDSAGLLPQFGKNILQSLNSHTGNVAGNSEGNPISEVIIQARGPLHWFDKNGVFQNDTLGKENILSYFRLGADRRGRYHSVLLTTHHLQTSQISYLRTISRARKRAGRDAPYLLAIPVVKGGRWRTFPHRRVAENQVIRRFSDVVIATGLPQHQVSQLGKRRFLLSGVRGQNLDGYVLILVQPFDFIERQSRWLTGKAAGLSVFMLLLAGGMAWFASRHLLDPLRSLDGGLKALRNRDFLAQVAPGSVGELALVAGQFNVVMTDLRDLEIAQSVQENLWPREGIGGPDWGIAGTCVSASDLGGDHHDWFLLPDGRLVFAIGDVAGHGIPSALIVASVKIALALNAHPDSTPDRILLALDRCFKTQAGNMKPMSFWLGMFDPKTRALQFANAGHNFPIVCPADGQPFMLEAQGYPLAARKKARYTFQETHLTAGGRVFLYSDGLVEAAGRDRTASDPLFGYQRLTALFQSVAGVPLDEARRQVFTCLRDWSGTDLPADDQTLVILHVGAPA